MLLNILKGVIDPIIGRHSRLDRESSPFWIPAFAGMTTLLVHILILLMPAPFVFAEDTIKILMHESPNDPLPSEQVESLKSLNGEVFFQGRSYTGSLDIISDENGLYVVNNLPFEKYIEGVVASEVGKDWEIEALKAQAVISRTYAIFNKTFNTGKSFHLTSSVLHQLYKRDNADHFITQAVQATDKEILTYEGRPINALYHATCEGKTELPEEVWVESYPYMKSVECNGVNAPYENWQKKFSFEDIGKSIGIEGIRDISIAAYTSTGRVKTLKITIAQANKNDPAIPSGSKEGEPGDRSLEQVDKGGPSEQTIEIKATELRRKLGYKELPSTDFSIATSGAEAFFDGKGYGHGVGLSQWGALAMAKQGKSYREILAHYYPGTTIRNSEELDSKVFLQGEDQR